MLFISIFQIFHMEFSGLHYNNNKIKELKLYYNTCYTMNHFSKSFSCLKKNGVFFHGEQKTVIFTKDYCNNLWHYRKRQGFHFKGKKIFEIKSNLPSPNIILTQKKIMLCSEIKSLRFYYIFNESRHINAQKRPDFIDIYIKIYVPSGKNNLFFTRTKINIK